MGIFPPMSNPENRVSTRLKLETPNPESPIVNKVCCKRDICDPTIRVHNPTRGAEMSMKGEKVSTSALYRSENLMDD